MTHGHNVEDTDSRFIINPITRAVRNESSKKVSLIQLGHNSERFTFECPKFIEGHDLSMCNKTEVNYLNVSFDNRDKKTGCYEVNDLQIAPDDDQKVICSWLISRNT